MPIHSGPHSTPSFRKGLWIKSLISVVVIASLGFLSGYFTATGLSDWYMTIEKPPFTPPNWVFGPAWSVIYLLIGLSFARIWQVYEKNRYPIVKRYAFLGLWIFGLHFLFNLAWTPVFFGLHQLGWGVVIILILLAFIAILIRHFYRLDRIAAFLLVPYLVWVTFATILTISIFVLNA
jgi:benzodiazapine receptor